MLGDVAQYGWLSGSARRGRTGSHRSDTYPRAPTVDRPTRSFRRIRR